MIERVAYFIATAGFVGRFPVAPGTAGSAAGLFVYAVVRLLGGVEVEAVVIAATLVLGIWASQVAERLLGGKDPGPVVIDEVAGMLITLAFLDVNVAGAIVGFVMFRILDVIKPFPAARLENLPGGLGVMMDDTMAGIYGQGLMRVLVAFFPGWLT